MIEVLELGATTIGGTVEALELLIPVSSGGSNVLTLLNDPPAPTEGQIWYRSDLNQMRAFVNAVTTIIQPGTTGGDIGTGTALPPNGNTYQFFELEGNPTLPNGFYRYDDQASAWVQN